jgi:cyclin L
MAEPTVLSLSNLSNPLATVEQLSSSGSQLDGIPHELETSILFAAARLTQFAGVLLRLPQDIVASAILLVQRFFLGPEGGSLRDYGAKVRKQRSTHIPEHSADGRQDISAAAVYLTAKISSLPKSPRSILNAYALLSSLGPTFSWTADHRVSNSCFPTILTLHQLSTSSRCV